MIFQIKALFLFTLIYANDKTTTGNLPPCNLDKELMILEVFIDNPHPDWTLECVDQKWVDDIFAAPQHLKPAFACLDINNPCEKVGYRLFADEFYKHMVEGRLCENCGKRLQGLMYGAIKRMADEHKDIFVNILSRFLL